MARIKRPTITPEQRDTVLGRFRGSNPSRGPNKPCTDGELIKLTAADGVSVLGPAPSSDPVIGKPAKSQDDKAQNTHLWVIDSDRLPYILEAPVATLGAIPKHSNLANSAHVAGEAWFINDKSIIISGASGRFPPRSPAELEGATEVFAAFAYRTQSLGWDYETNTAFRFQIG